MKIYYDSECKVCLKIKNFLLKIKKDDGEVFEFIGIEDSKFSEYTKDTVVVQTDASSDIFFTHGKALRIIFKNTKKPYYFMGFLPIFLLNFLYVFLRNIRKYNVKKIFFTSIFLVLFVLIFITSFFSDKIFLSLGKYSFLELHMNTLAERLLESSIKIDSNNARSYFLLGRVYFVEGKLGLSEKAYLRSTELDPENEQNYYGLGLTYGYLNYLTLAAQNFQKYLSVVEEKKVSGKIVDYPSGHWAGYNDLAWVYFLQGDFVSAEKITREALEKYNNPWLLNMLGAILLNQNKKEEAKKYFEQAQVYAKNMNVEDFGEAYTGDSRAWQEKGFANMKEIIEKNIVKAQ